MRTITVTMDEDTVKRVDALVSYERGMRSRSAVVKKMIDEYLKVEHTPASATYTSRKEDANKERATRICDRLIENRMCVPHSKKEQTWIERVLSSEDAEWVFKNLRYCQMKMEERKMIKGVLNSGHTALLPEPA